MKRHIKEEEEEESRIILKFFLNNKGVASPKNLRVIFRSLLMFYYIIKLSNSLYFVSIKILMF